MSCVLYNKEQISLASYMIKYFKQRPPDCTLFSEDNCKILIHKELLYQTQYMRSMIKSASIGCCCSQIEIMCPSLTINELEIIVQFLYSGKISCANQGIAVKISNNLTELFGFPVNFLKVSLIKSPEKKCQIRNTHEIPEQKSFSPTEIKQELTENIFIKQEIIDPDPNSLCDPLDESELTTSEFRPVNHVTTTGINVELLVNEKATNTIKTHHCSKCQKSFATSQVLKSHMLFSHSGAECNYCGTEFMNKTGKDYQFHITQCQNETRNEKEKDSKCGICSKKFNRIKYVQKHIKVCHKNACHFCYQTFQTSQETSDHIAEYHGNKIKYTKNESMKKSLDKRKKCW